MQRWIKKQSFWFLLTLLLVPLGVWGSELRRGDAAYDRAAVKRTVQMVKAAADDAARSAGERRDAGMAYSAMPVKRSSSGNSDGTALWARM